MIELVRLERRHEDFARRHTRVIVASLDGLDDARQTQVDFPHLLVLTDQGRGLTDALGVLHPGAVTPDGRAADAPTTILVDRRGTVRWLYRSPEVVARLSPDEVLQAVDRTMPPEP